MAKKEAAPKTEAPKEAKTKCPISKEDFGKYAQPMMVSVGDSKVIAAPKQFSTGSFGWHNNEKLIVIVNGVPVKVQVNIILTVVGSKSE